MFRKFFSKLVATVVMTTVVASSPMYGIPLSLIGDGTNSKGFTEAAIKKKDTVVLERLLVSGLNLDQDYTKESPAIMAARSGDLATLKLLAAHGADMAVVTL